MKTFYVTTPIYYTNGAPHLGHAYTTIAADTLARYKKMQGYKVFFLTGTDEHGQKVEKAAKDIGKTPKQFVDEIVEQYKTLWTALDIEYDKFIRTTDNYHEKAVQNVFQQLYDKGFIYKGNYEGWYCVPCETFLTDSQLLNAKCPDCGRDVKKEKEESYFFALSKFKPQLLKLFEENKQFVEPQSRWHEAYNFFKDDLRDLSVSRRNVKWGIPVPFDKEHVIYVWLDALFNYLTALGYDGKNKKTIDEFWPADVHLVGKEIARFHAVYWPAMLMAAGVELPKKIYAHGWWTIEGDKMSKSKGNYVEPHAVIAKYGADAFRYFLLRENTFGEDGDYSQKAFDGRYNGELADEFGNLANRTLVMVNRYCNGKIPAKPKEGKLKKVIEEKVNLYEEKMDEYSFNRALEATWDIVREANKLVNDTEPWKLAKEGKQKDVDAVMYELCEALRVAAILLFPFTPRKSSELYAALGLKNIEKAKLKDCVYGKSKEGTAVAQTLVLFPKVEAKK
ncbi:MAG: methionine--tRNA ligase [Candidatus Micrarchaeota archaeon]